MSITNVVIFGATGMTGQVVLQRAAAAGYNVTVLVRDPTRLPADHKASKVVVGDVLNKENVMEAMKGQEAVIITLGTRKDHSPTTLMSEGTKNIVEAMEARKIRKVIACVSGFLLMDYSEMPSRLAALTEDHIRMYEVLKGCRLDYVAIMPPHIGDDLPLTEKYVVAEGILRGHKISTHDLAHFMVKCLSRADWDRKRVGVWANYKKS